MSKKEIYGTLKKCGEALTGDYEGDLVDMTAADAREFLTDDRVVAVLSWVTGHSEASIVNYTVTNRKKLKV